MFSIYLRRGRDHGHPLFGMYDDLSAYTQRLVKGGIEYRRDASKDERLWTLVSSTLSSDPGNVSSLDEITQALRVVRNACAGVAETQDLVVQKQIHESIINLLRRLSHEAPTELHHLVALQAGAQALSNILTANSHAQDVIFPVLLTNKAASVDAEPGSDNPQSEAHVPESNLLA
ncbi:hypothetical protein M427DRAFT_413298 [Gonapodya prolifera JEL478]|uniref:Uncharacterized protein n=1 Tax=Gonapodya prolifera (strain JEL478) TaxID=1344416 RepID=A0A139A5X4_GONPJ|nr:hypothetical protein M427DRAFT_413298 [Gonapodya prolifera JEL478]|eukprot:KXS12058.1 hypothetical protein M427DRAFT_413298 [Gonapodya prolifera JEL478]